MDHPSAPQVQSWTAFTCCAAALLCLCVLPVWLAPALPMQDFPQHLFITAVLRGAHPEWTDAYVRQLTLAPYTGFYWVACALTPLLGVEAAGRAFVTGYLLLFVVWMWRLAAELRSPPWAALLAFPFALGSTYFHGFLNYLFALPLVLLALQELRESAAVRLGSARLAGHAVLLCGIAWFHPLCLYVYAGLAALDLLLSRRSATALFARAAPGALALVTLALWQAASYRDTEGQVWWAPAHDTLRYLSLLFTGLRPQPIWIALHTACFLGMGAVLAAHRPWRALDRRAGLQALALLLAYLLLPFRIGSYTYVSWRLAPLFGLALAALFARVSLSRRSGLVLALACGVVTADVVLLQLQVGHESAEIRALVPNVQRGARATAINVSISSSFLHPDYFGSIHEHDIFYYSLAAGGLSPFLWSDPLIPVRKQAHFGLTPPRSLKELLAQGYSVVFTRNANPELAHALERAYVQRGERGAWRVFERR